MKKSHVKIYKKYYGLIVLLSLIVASSFLVISYVNQVPSPGHGGDQIFIALSSGYISLQDAISSGVLVGPPMSLSSTGTASLSASSHLASSIWINLNGTEKTLQDAINQGSLCCSSCTGDSIYTQQIPPQAHYASHTLITLQNGTEETLQKAIDTKEFCNLTFFINITNINPTGTQTVIGTIGQQASFVLYCGNNQNNCLKYFTRGTTIVLHPGPSDERFNSWTGDCTGTNPLTCSLYLDSNKQVGAIFNPYCGDGACNNGETCSSCVGDCGACPPAGGGGGGCNDCICW